MLNFKVVIFLVKNIMYNKLLVLVFVFLQLKGNSFGQYCNSNSRYTQEQFFDSTQITVWTNIQYGIANDYLGNPDTLHLDLYYPNLTIDLSPKRPFIMLFHGGGFSSGDKQSGDIQDLCVHLALRGFICASVNYRLGHDFTEYGQYKARYRAIQDGHAAVRYVVNNANAVRLDTSWIFVGGQSAGSLLALGMVYADQSELDSVSLLYGATATSGELGNLYTSGNNLTNTYTFKGIFNNWGGVTETEMDIDEMLPTVAFHGELDTLVKIDADNSFLNYTFNGSRAIHNELILNNICSELTVDSFGGHGIYRNASSVFRAQRASCFFKSVFCNNCSNFYSTDSIPSNCSSVLSFQHHDIDEKINILPNPIENSFKIEGINGLLNISIYNLVGQLVYNNDIYNESTQLSLQSGIYFLNIKQYHSNKIYKTKIIKK